MKISTKEDINTLHDLLDTLHNVGITPPVDRILIGQQGCYVYYSGEHHSVIAIGMTPKKV